MAETFGEFMRREVGPRWVIHARTKNVLDRYGEDMAYLSRKKYKALQDAYENKTGYSASGYGRAAKWLEQAEKALQDGKWKYQP